MYTEEHINSAIQAGIINAATAEALKQHVAQLQSNQSPDEEHFKLVTGFNDIFVVIATILLLTAITWIFGNLHESLGTAAAAVCAWGLSEFFINKRKMALPAIVLLIAFVANVLLTVIFLSNPEISINKQNQGITQYIVGILASSFAAWLHWKRFHVPITVAAGAAAVIACLLGMLSANADTRAWLPVFSFIAGLAVFATALWWDAADTERKTRKSDVAFWLHLLAAPLLVHPVFMMLDVLSGHTSSSQAVIVFMLYLLIGFVSLMIDRRALMVSALAYVLYTFSSLLKTLGVVDLSFAITALAIGAGLLLLSAFWHRCRHYVLRFTPPALKPYLPK